METSVVAAAAQDLWLYLPILSKFCRVFRRLSRVLWGCKYGTPILSLLAFPSLCWQLTGRGSRATSSLSHVLHTVITFTCRPVHVHARRAHGHSGLISQQRSPSMQRSRELLGWMSACGAVTTTLISIEGGIDYVYSGCCMTSCLSSGRGLMGLFDGDELALKRLVRRWRAGGTHGYRSVLSKSSLRIYGHFGVSVQCHFFLLSVPDGFDQNFIPADPKKWLNSWGQT